MKVEKKLASNVTAFIGLSYVERNICKLQQEIETLVVYHVVV